MEKYNEQCALKSRLYYLECSNCDARKRHVCYVTQDELDEHLKSFAELFESDNGSLEDQVEKFEDMFTVHQGGFL